MTIWLYGCLIEIAYYPIHSAKSIGVQQQCSPVSSVLGCRDGLSVLRNNHAAIVRRPANELQKLDAQNLLQKCQAGKCG